MTCSSELISSVSDTKPLNDDAGLYVVPLTWLSISASSGIVEIALAVAGCGPMSMRFPDDFPLPPEARDKDDSSETTLPMEDVLER